MLRRILILTMLFAVVTACSKSDTDKSGHSYALLQKDVPGVYENENSLFIYDNDLYQYAYNSSRHSFRIQNTTLSSKFKTAHHPNHVSCKIPHGLHTFFILRSFFSVKTMYHVPIGRTGDWHLCNPKIFINHIKSCRGSSSSCYCNSSTRFKFEGVITSSTVKNSVQKIINTSTWMCKIYWCCKYKAICCFSLFNKFIHAIIFNHTLSCFLTDITLKTICYRLSSKLNNLCLYFF